MSIEIKMIDYSDISFAMNLIEDSFERYNVIQIQIAKSIFADGSN